MKFFSSYPTGLILRQFGIYHIVAILFLLAGVVLIIAFRNQLKATPVLQKRILLAGSVIAWTLEVTYHVWVWLTDRPDFLQELLPFELCYISLWLTPILIITKKQWVFDIFYFSSFFALGAILFPIITFGPDHFRFYHFFYNHNFVLWVNTFFIAVKGFKINFRSYKRFMIFILPTAVILRIIDGYFNTNYMMLYGRSDQPSPLDFLGSGIPYFVRVVVLGVAVLTILYFIGPKEKKRSLT